MADCKGENSVTVAVEGGSNEDDSRLEEPMDTSVENGTSDSKCISIIVYPVATASSLPFNTR